MLENIIDENRYKDEVGKLFSITLLREKSLDWLFGAVSVCLEKKVFDDYPGQSMTATGKAFLDVYNKNFSNPQWCIESRARTAKRTSDAMNQALERQSKDTNDALLVSALQLQQRFTEGNFDISSIPPVISVVPNYDEIVANDEDELVRKVAALEETGHLAEIPKVNKKTPPKSGKNRPGRRNMLGRLREEQAEIAAEAYTEERLIGPAITKKRRKSQVDDLNEDSTTEMGLQPTNADSENDEEDIFEISQGTTKKGKANVKPSRNSGKSTRPLKKISSATQKKRNDKEFLASLHSEMEMEDSSEEDIPKNTEATLTNTAGKQITDDGDCSELDADEESEESEDSEIDEHELDNAEELSFDLNNFVEISNSLSSARPNLVVGQRVKHVKSRQCSVTNLDVVKDHGIIRKLVGRTWYVQWFSSSVEQILYRHTTSDIFTAHAHEITNTTVEKSLCPIV